MTTHLAHPPKPAIAFRVGVVGHRPDRLPEDDAGLENIRSRVAQVLEAIKMAVGAVPASASAPLYDLSRPALLKANSPLAEGADRLFAEEALRLGYHLNCIMPFSQAEFEHDFVDPHAQEAGSRTRFRTILREAEETGRLTRFELDGHPEERHDSYRAAGRVLLNQSDLLVVIWDGGAPAGVGGTVDTLREAVEFGVPVVWIDSRSPHGWRILKGQGALAPLRQDGPWPASPAPADEAEDTWALQDAVITLVNEELGPPDADDEDAPITEGWTNVFTYFEEDQARWNFALTWRIFRDLFGHGRLHLPPARVGDYIEDVRGAWPVLADQTSPPPSQMISAVNEALRSHYAWASRLADRYADSHRSELIWASFLPFAATVTGLLPLAGHFSKHTGVLIGIAELVVIFFMIALPAWAHRRRWHQKWMEYRVLSELIRELKILAPLGGASPLPRASPHLASYGDPTRSWMYWLTRAIARATPTPNVQVTQAYVDEQIRELLDVIGRGGRRGEPALGQLGFHRLSSERMETIHRRLRRSTFLLFAVILAAVFANWALGWWAPDLGSRLRNWLIFLSACLPAVSAALAAINNLGEFARLYRRSQAMASGFVEVRRRLRSRAAQPPPRRLSEVTDLAAEMTKMMVDENTEWRILVLDLPHTAG
jgi:hypothetical protein